MVRPLTSRTRGEGAWRRTIRENLFGLRRVERRQQPSCWSARTPSFRAIVLHRLPGTSDDRFAMLHSSSAFRRQVVVQQLAPRLIKPNSLALPSVLNCLGTRSIQAAGGALLQPLAKAMRFPTRSGRDLPVRQEYFQSIGQCWIFARNSVVEDDLRFAALAIIDGWRKRASKVLIRFGIPILDHRTGVL
jgi:hypothetical protein